MQEDKIIAVIGMGYVGLPLAVEFAKKYKTYGYDINTTRIEELKKGDDVTQEVDKETLLRLLEIKNEQSGLRLTSLHTHIKGANVFIITVPTPVDRNNGPILTYIEMASETIGSILKKGDIVIYESTVYPGVTEEICVPILENSSGLRFNSDFYCGYSPERVNPGDKKNTITKIKKVTSGSTKEVALVIDAIYKSVIEAGTHLAPSIKVAEAAKVIENAQRDINIAFVNELAKIFNKLAIDTHDVLKAAGTKWNFLPFKPGLVGGHCIGVDPYYLARKAQEVGYHPEIILSGRRMNEGMGGYVATEVLKLMVSHKIAVKDAKVLVLGITFKENCPDIRNTKVIDIYRGLTSFHMNVEVYDPWASQQEVAHAYGITMLTDLKGKKYDAIIHAVAHKEFSTLPIASLKTKNAVVYDVKGTLGKQLIDKRL